MSPGQKLEIVDTIKEGVGIGIKNIGPILVNILLWGLTCWIPYFGVGTTIGLFVGIVTKASRGEVIPMTEIFDPKYRKFMGEYFLTAGLVFLGVAIGFLFFIIPGYVIAISWSLAILLVIDKGKNPTEAITLSNNCTYGNKWRIFGVYFFTVLAFVVLVSILGTISAAIIASTGSLSIGIIFSLLYIIIMVFYMFILIGLQASIYKQLTSGV
jgi:hypothetical protein